MRFLLVVSFLVCFFNTSLTAQTTTTDNCKCADITSNTVKWAKSSRGNLYCTHTTRTGKTSKQYKKYFGENPPTQLTATDISKGKVWRKVGRGRNVGKWYKGQPKK